MPGWPYYGSGPGAAADFTTIPGLVYYLDGNNSALRHLTGSTLTQWDNGGSAGGSVSAAAANKPQLVSADLNGKDVIQFTNSPMTFSSSSFVAANAASSVVFVFQELDHTVDGSLQSTLFTYPAIGGKADGIYWGTGGILGYAGGGGSSQCALAFDIASYHKFIFTSDGAGTRQFIFDGTTLSPSNTAADWGDALALGSYAASGTDTRYTFHGNLALFLVFDHVLTASEIVTLNQIILSRYAL